MCPESLELSSVFMTEDILPRIASDWATSLGDAWLQEIDQRVQESYSGIFLIYYCLCGQILHL
jgi:hypothetical protein